MTIENGTSSVSVETIPTQVNDFDLDGVQDLMVKFDRASVYEMLSPGSVQLTVRGSFTSGFHFEGSNIINVIDKGNEHIDEDPSSVKY